MKFRTKLYYSIGLLFVLIVIFLIILIRMINQQTVNMSEVVTDLSDRKKVTFTIQTEIGNMGRELSDISTNPPENLLSQTENEWEQSRLNIHSSIDTLKTMDNREETQTLIAKFNTLFKTYEDIGEQIIISQKTNRNANYDNFLWTDVRSNRERLQQITDLLYAMQDQEMKDQLLRNRKTYSAALNLIYIFAIVSFIIGIAFTLWMIKSLTRDLNDVTAVMSRVASNGTQFPRIKVKAKDEIGAIAVTYNQMAEVLEKQAKQEKNLVTIAENQSWLKSKVAEITSLFNSAEDFSTLAQLFINKISPIVKANYGVLYIRKETEKEIRFVRMASYAELYNQSSIKSFGIGEGLIGQCAKEKEPILLTDIPEDYVKISSGSSVGTPKTIYILPAHFEGEVSAVLEIATFTSFNSLQFELINEVMNHIGITIHSIGNRMKVKRLLQESQTLAEELQSQSEELQMQQEELRSINEKLEAQYKNSEEKKEELEKISIMLEEKAEELAVTSQYKTEFLANMSHELRTPLNSMLILAQMLIEKLNENLSSKQLEYIKTIYSSGTDLLHLINEVLDLAKVEAGKIEIIPSEVSFAHLKSLVEKYFTPQVNQKRIDFHIKLDEKLPPSIYTDEHRLQQILRNLLSNAYKFTENGRISLLIQLVPGSKTGAAAGNKKEDMVSFTVKDTGIGIPKEKQQLIFDAFVQADGTTSRRYGGTGLGLSICREIAQLLGGYIQVKSEEGVGSAFTLFLPLKDLAKPERLLPAMDHIAADLEKCDPGIWSNLEENHEGEIPKSTLITGKKILIVDDDMRNIFALSSALEEYDIKVLFGENGREGIEVLQQNTDIDLILMDIMMPEMDGFEAIRQIRNMPEFNKLPIIALTAKAMKHNREECIEAGASDYISKPIDLDQLYSLIQVWLYR